MTLESSWSIRSQTEQTILDHTTVCGFSGYPTEELNRQLQAIIDALINAGIDPQKFERRRKKIINLSDMDFPRGEDYHKRVMQNQQQIDETCERFVELALEAAQGCNEQSSESPSFAKYPSKQAIDTRKDTSKRVSDALSEKDTVKILLNDLINFLPDIYTRISKVCQKHTEDSEINTFFTFFTTTTQSLINQENENTFSLEEIIITVNRLYKIATRISNYIESKMSKSRVLKRMKFKTKLDKLLYPLINELLGHIDTHKNRFNSIYQ